MELKNKDIVLLCIDGLWNMLSDEGFAGVVKKGVEIETKIYELIGKVYKAGEEDNITVVLVESF